MRRASSGGRVLGVVLFASAVSLGVGRAQQPDASAAAAAPRDYGVGNINVLQIPAAAFQPSLTGNFTFDANFYFYPGSGGAVYAVAPVQLPSGSKIVNVGLFYDDTDAVNDVAVYLLELPGYNASASHNQIGTASSSGSGGKSYASGVVDYTVNNNVRWGSGAQLVAEVYAGSASTKFKGVDIWWKRQISPAPATPTFGDVPKDHPFFATIEAFARAGITSGCGGGNFCPTGAVTRQEIAKFMTRALGLYWPDNVP